MLPDVAELPRLRPFAQSLVGGMPLALAVLSLALAGGCTSVSEYVRNGFKVGPNYRKPPAPVANEWIDSRAQGINVVAKDLAGWWTAFNDPKLNVLVEAAYRQNLTLRSAGTRILAARAQRNIAAGNLLPQLQQAVADAARVQTSSNTANPLPNPLFSDNLAGFNLSWELDFWGRFRRAVESANADLDASVENYDDALVLLVSEVASAYVQIRVFQQELRYVESNIVMQTKLARDAEARLKGGAGALIDQGQMRSNLYDTLAIKEQFLIGLRQVNNQLCVLLGIPVRDLLPDLGDGPIPLVPPEAAVGMPADLLRRRPDLRRAERLVASQSARIGIAVSDLYPHIAIVGSLGYEARNFTDLFATKSFIGSIMPSVQWNVLNYGRLLNAIRVQDALFQGAVLDYQQAVLVAGREVEDAIVYFLRSQVRNRQLTISADEAKIAADEALRLSKDVKFDLNRAFVTNNFLVGQQDKLAQTRGDIALSFIQIYKALGGGWEIRLADSTPAKTAPPENLPPPMPMIGSAELLGPQEIGRDDTRPPAASTPKGN